MPEGPYGIQGLSPRVRSYQRSNSRRGELCGSISACAELPPPYAHRPRRSRVYLRVCGVTVFGCRRTDFSQGLSPRVRSYLKAAEDFGAYFGSISACAELPFHRSLARGALRVYLRVCGVTTSLVKTAKPLWGLSPRVRSYLEVRHQRVGLRGSISACAELPQRIAATTTQTGVYLRVCGVTPATICRKRTGRNANDRP